ncbi:MAG TPA: hypothetical protein VGO98_02100 [Candidatus Saccharimonadales bacterium]|jgi:hypothetical protein|nr:hypothetical protein [Candidatus Saccharimonadales bacterium]
MLEVIKAPQTEHLETNNGKKPNYLLRRIGAIGALSVAALGAHEGTKLPGQVVEHIQTPIEYSAETTTYTARQNDGLDAITSQVEGINTVDFSLVKSHIRTMPENADVFSDGIVGLGETFVIPAEVKKH